MNETKTIIGMGSSVRGVVEADEDLVVEGRVEGTISLTMSLIVDPSGTVQAEVSCKAVVVHGVLMGNIQALETVRIAAGGRMAGDIRAPQVVLEEGAAFNGNIDMGDFSLEAEAPPTSVPEVSRQRPLSVSPRQPTPTRTPPAPPVPETKPESESPRPSLRPGAGFSRPPMPVPSRPAPAPYPSAPSKRQGAPEPRVRPVGRIKIKKPTM